MSHKHRSWLKIYLYFSPNCKEAGLSQARNRKAVKRKHKLNFYVLRLREYIPIAKTRPFSQLEPGMTEKNVGKEIFLSLTFRANGPVLNARYILSADMSFQ